MKHQRTKLTILLMLLMVTIELQAQSNLYVKDKTGNQTSFALNNIRKLTFTPGIMTVNETGGNSNNYTLDEIRYLSFRDLTTDIVPVGPAGIYPVMLYPNPVSEELKISFNSLPGTDVKIEIADVQGKILYKQTIKSQDENNIAVIPVIQLQGGLYLCRIQNGYNLQTVKFIKH